MPTSLCFHDQVQITELPLQAGTLRVGDATASELETRIIRYNSVRTTSEDQYMVSGG
jgi:hypothetical protein